MPLRRTVTSLSLRAIWAIVLASACSGGTDTTAPATSVSIVGTWTLQSVNGASLPYLMDQSGADKSEMTSDVLTFLATGQFTEIAQVRLTSGGQVTTTSVPQAGTYAANKGTVVLTFAGSDTQARGTQTGATLAVAINGLAFVYQKQ